MKQASIPVPTPADVEVLLSIQLQDEWESMTEDEQWLSILDILVDEGRFDKDRPEDDLAHKLSSEEVGINELSDGERDLYEERLMPMMAAYMYRPATFEAEFAEMRQPEFFDPPDPDQLTLL
ncbi:hypothetical protein [Mesorhizobium sp. CAU 1732]|uniref:hypothetical protein n=1 Tax=Mesorhizobium sp. CAU 1732 TaxID=3140358 RepID=UPI0032601DA9